MEPKLDSKAEYGFAARDALKQGLTISNNFEQSRGMQLSPKAQYGFGARDMANAGMPFTENYEQYAGIPMKAPAVVNTAPLRETIQKNSQFINTAQQAFYHTPTGQNISSPTLTPNVKPTASNATPTTNTSQTNQSTVQPPQPIQNTFGNNPALSSAVDQLNATISTFKGEMTPEQQATYNSIKEASDKYASAIASATSAKESGDFRTFNEKTNEAKVASDLRQEEINNLLSSTKDLRQKYIDSLNPSQNEIDLETQLADLRTSAELGAEAQYGLGRPLSISTGRAEKVLNQGAIQEKNLLAKLGIEVKKREGKSEGLKAGIGFLQDDMQLQMKVQERLDKQQEAILARADKLNDNQRNAMATLAEKFKDIDLDTASPEVLRGIQQFALSQGVDATLAVELVKATHDQQVYDNAIAGTKATTGNFNLNNYSGENSGIIKTILGSGKFTSQQASTIANAIGTGEDPFTVVKNQAKGLMDGTTKSALNKSEAARDAMYELDKSFKDYYAAGGDSGIIKGTMEKVYNRLGEVKDPELAGLAVEVSAALQKYRNAISGTAYSEQEGREIASVFPGIAKGEILNSVTTKARLKVFESDIDAAYKVVLGDAYAKLKNLSSGTSSEDSNTVLKSGDAGQTSSGMKYTIE